MHALAQFPSQGDLIKFVYDALGIIPSKSEQILDLKIKNKSLQRCLQRLAKEEGVNYLENFETHIKSLINTILDLFPTFQLQSSILDTLQDIFQCYLTAVLTNHTYLDKKGSLEFVIQTTILPRLSISVLKYKECYADFFKKIHAPTDFYWFLGTNEKTPLALIIQWIYESEDLTHRQFHTLDAQTLNTQDFEQQEKDLENTQTWLKSKSLPPFTNIKTAFKRAFISHKISDERQETYLFFLLIARFCTYCQEQINETYGAIITQVHYANKIKQYINAIYKDFHLFYNDNLKISLRVQKDTIQRDPYSIKNNTNVDEMLNFAIFESFSKNCLQSGEQLALHVQRVGHTNDLPDYDESVPRNLNLVTVKNGFSYWQQNNQTQYLANIQNHSDGYSQVLNNRMSFDTWYQNYKTCGNDIVHPWLEQWIRGILAFKNNQWADALNYMDKAFETIRYAAGIRQERFLEDYLLISLANQKGYKSFKQGYKWGTFMNHFGGLKPLFHLESDKEIKDFYEAKKNDFKTFESMKNNMDMKTLTKMVFHWKYNSE